MTTLTFTASDGKVTTLQTVKVQVLDVNRAPRIQVANHAVVVGKPFRLTIGLGSDAGLVTTDADGATQTQALQVSFSELPEGAVYNAVARNLDWIPGPGQVGDYVITAHVSDAFEEARQTFTLRVLAEAAAGAPKILVVTTPSTPVQPGQTVFVTARAEAYSAIASLVVKVRGSGLGTDAWQSVTLDERGRVKLVPTQPGLVDIEVHAVDADGFEKTYTHTLKVKNPADTEAPAIAWVGALEEATAQSLPALVQGSTLLRASLREAQLMGYSLAMAHARSNEWRTLVEQSSAAANVDTVIDLFELDPAQYLNGVYKLRLSAWDIVGRTAEVEAIVVIDSAAKSFDEEHTCDRVFTLGTQTFALNRSLETGISADKHAADFANWRIPAFNFRLSNDQPLEAEQGGTAPWEEGARVWLRMPSSLSQPNAPMIDLAFTLGTTQEAMLTGADAPMVRHPVFDLSQGFGVVAFGAEEDAHDNERADTVQLQGRRLYDQTSGLPWVPQRFILIAPDGTRYSLDAAGRLKGVAFADGTRWLVTDAGIVAAGANAHERIEFLRDTEGRIKRVSGVGENGEQAAIVYRYDRQKRLVLVRALDASDHGTAYAYQPNGKTYPDTIAKNLGAAFAWTMSANANQWQGTLQAGQTTTIAFALRESEIDSTIKVRGAVGAVLVAIQSEGIQSIDVMGAITLGQTTYAGVTTTLVRITEAGLKWVRLSGNSNATVSVSIAGDVVRDGNVDGLDTGAASSDINGDGVVDAKDRQALYANYGFRANKGPVVASTLPVIKTHTDLRGSVALNAVAQDFEGDDVFWRVLSATHGNARLSGDGQTLWFEPEAGYAGPATVQVQADDGFVASAPILIHVTVSSAALVRLKIKRIHQLQIGAFAAIQVTADFEDEADVALPNDALTISSSDPTVVEIANGVAHGLRQATATIVASRNGIQGINSTLVTNVKNLFFANGAGLELQVYPTAVTLPPLVGQRRLITTSIFNETIDSSELKYFVSNPDIAEIGLNGVIQAKAQGVAIVSVVHEYRQREIELRVQAATIGATFVSAKDGATIQDTAGNMVMIAPGALPVDATVDIQALPLASIGMPLPAPTILDCLGAVEVSLPADATIPLQLALRVEAPVDPTTGEPGQLAAGTEVHFWRRGVMIDEQGALHDTWWLIDNGRIGTDGLARTSSPPYPGFMAGGSILVTSTKSEVNAATGEVKVTAVLLNWDAMWMQLAQCAFMASAMPLAGPSMFGLLATMSVPISVMKFTLDGTYRREITLTQNPSDGKFRLNVPALPPLTPDAPVLTKVDYDADTRKLTLEQQGPQCKNEKWKIWIEPLSAVFTEPLEDPVRARLFWSFGDDTINRDNLVVTLPRGVAISLHRVYVERLVATLNSQGAVVYPTTGLKSRPVNLEKHKRVTVVIEGRRISIFKTSTQLVFQKFVEKNEKDEPLALFGRRTDQAVFSPDVTLLYVAGKNSQVYVIDTTTLTIAHTVSLSTKLNDIASIAIVHGRLYAADSQGAMMAWINVEQHSTSFLNAGRLALPGNINAGKGFSDLGANADRYLVVTAPIEVPYISGRTAAQGNVYLIDTRGIINEYVVPESAVKELSLDKFETNHGKSPTYVIGGEDTGEFMVSMAKDHNSGLVAVKWAVDAEGAIQGVEIKKPKLTPASPDGTGERSDDKWLNRKHQENIQRAAEAAVIQYEGVEYALVADYNFVFNDPHWMSDSIFGKQIGGKIGIVRDPFGKQGGPTYMGATAPIVGVALDHLALSKGGMLYVHGFVEEGGFRYYAALFVWDAKKLIKRALEVAKAGTKRSLPIDLKPNEQKPGEYLPVPAAQPQRYNKPSGAIDWDWFQWIYDIASSELNTKASVTLGGQRYGDIVEVDLKKLLADNHIEIDPDNPDFQMPMALVKHPMDGSAIANSSYDFDTKSTTFGEFKGGHVLAYKYDEEWEVVQSTSTQDNVGVPKFRDSGKFYFVPQIEYGAVQKGKSLKAMTAKGVVQARVKKINGEDIDDEVIIELSIELLEAKFDDYRELLDGADGNSQMTRIVLLGSVGPECQNHPIDVARIQHRLRYLGYPSINATLSFGEKQVELEDSLRRALATPTNVLVDGRWDNEELILETPNKPVPRSIRPLVSPAPFHVTRLQGALRLFQAALGMPNDKRNAPGDRSHIERADGGTLLEELKTLTTVTDPSSLPAISEDALTKAEHQMAYGNRLGAYITLYNATGRELFLMQAQIASYSGFIGAGAIYGNSSAKFVAGHQKYEVNLDQFSTDIDAGNIRAIRDDVRNGLDGMACGTGKLTNDDLLVTDRGVWATKAMAQEFPGDLLFAGRLTNASPGFRKWGPSNDWIDSFNALVSHGSFFAALFGMRPEVGDDVPAILKPFLGLTRQKSTVGGQTVYTPVHHSIGGLIGRRPAEFKNSPDHEVVPSADGKFLTVWDKNTGIVVLMFEKDPEIQLNKQIDNVVPSRSVEESIEIFAPRIITRDWLLSMGFAYVTGGIPGAIVEAFASTAVPQDDPSLYWGTAADALERFGNLFRDEFHSQHGPGEPLESWAEYLQKYPDASRVHWARHVLQRFVGAIQFSPEAYPKQRSWNNPNFEANNYYNAYLSKMHDPAKEKAASIDDLLPWLNCARAPRWAEFESKSNQITLFGGSLNWERWGTNWARTIVEDAAEKAQSLLERLGKMRFEIAGVSENGWTRAYFDHKNGRVIDLLIENEGHITNTPSDAVVVATGAADLVACTAAGTAIGNPIFGAAVGATLFAKALLSNTTRTESAGRSLAPLLRSPTVRSFRDNFPNESQRESKANNGLFTDLEDASVDKMLGVVMDSELLMSGEKALIVTIVCLRRRAAKEAYAQKDVKKDRWLGGYLGEDQPRRGHDLIHAVIGFFNIHDMVVMKGYFDRVCIKLAAPLVTDRNDPY